LDVFYGGLGIIYYSFHKKKLKKISAVFFSIFFIKTLDPVSTNPDPQLCLKGRRDPEEGGQSAFGYRIYS
jgi:hypothetical protein